MVLPEPIKSIGSFEVPIKLHKEVTARLSVKVVGSVKDGRSVSKESPAAQY